MHYEKVNISLEWVKFMQILRVLIRKKSTYIRLYTNILVEMHVKKVLMNTHAPSHLYDDKI